LKERFFSTQACPRRKSWVLQHLEISAPSPTEKEGDTRTPKPTGPCLLAEEQEKGLLGILHFQIHSSSGRGYLFSDLNLSFIICEKGY
jgi:hypothetical protein